MSQLTRSCAVVFLTLTTTATITAPPSCPIISKDVAILGGGASGTFAAIRLREDFGRSIVVIEKADRLGGHTDTYSFPPTNSSIDYGVQAYSDYGPTVGLFQRFGIDVGPKVGKTLKSINVDITNGKLLEDYIPPNPNQTKDAFLRWQQFAEKYESITLPGLWNFPKEGDIPSDLLKPFGEIAERDNLTAVVPQLTAISNEGVGGIKDELMLYVLFHFGAPFVREFNAGRVFYPKGHNSILYQRAGALLGSDVHLSTHVIQAERSNKGVRLLIQDSKGEATLVEAKRLIVTPAPNMENLKVLDLDEKEKNVFGTWGVTRSFVGIVKVPAIPENYSIAYIPKVAIPSNWMNVRDHPFTLRLDGTGPAGHPLFRFLFSTTYEITHDEVKSQITNQIQKLGDAGTFNSTSPVDVEFLALADHRTAHWTQTADMLKNGFVQDLYALQGHRMSWYTSGIISSDYSSNVWTFTETVLPKVVEGL